MMKRVVIITGSELRHDFLRKYIASFDTVEVLQTFCESQDANLQSMVEKSEENELRKLHLSLREQTEKDFFELFCQRVEDKSNPVFIKKGDINQPAHVEAIKKLNPDIIVSYGCSIIRSELLQQFEHRFINIHLGLSPYYRGSGTNFWPFVNNEIQYVGVTYMYIDEGIDTGKIIHQIKSRVYPGDDIHKIGNRLIGDMAGVMVKIIEQFDTLADMQALPFDKSLEKYYRKKDFTEASLQQTYANFSNGLVDKYLAEKEILNNTVPIIINPAI